MAGRFKVVTTVSMFIKSHLHISHGLTNVAVTARTVSFVDRVWCVSVFVFKVEKAFDLSCLPKDNEIVLGIREIV